MVNINHTHLLGFGRSFAVFMGLCVWLGLSTATEAFTLVSARGRWSHVQGGTRILTIASAHGAYVYWGTPRQPEESQTVGPQSGLAFIGLPNTQVEIGQQFALGQFQHLNEQIGSGTAAQAATLNISLFFQEIGRHEFKFTFAVDETPNSDENCEYPSVIPCADRISWLVDGQDTQVLMYQNHPHTLELMGFQNLSTGQQTLDFISQEGGTSHALLYARLTRIAPEQDIPEPSMVVGLGLGAIALAGRRHYSRR